MRRTVGTLLVCVSLVAPTFALPAGASGTGVLDTTFSGDGKIAYAAPWNVWQLRATAHGGLVVASIQNTTSATTSYKLERLTAAGVPDPTFSGDGQLQADFGISGRTTPSVVTLSGSQTLVFGTVLTPGSAPASYLGVARYTGGGNPDNTFSADGRTTLALPSGYAAAMLDGYVLADGRIEFAAAVHVPGNPYPPTQLWLGRLKSDGSPDTTLGPDGLRVITSFNAYAALDATFSPSGRLYVVKADRGSSAATLEKYRADGALDTSFSSDGILPLHCLFQASPSYNGFATLLIDATGRPVIYCIENLSNDVVFHRFTSGGKPDTLFSGNGALRVVTNAFSDDGITVTIDVHDRIAVSSIPSVGPPTTLEIRRFNAAGVADPAFGTAGFAALHFGGDYTFGGQPSGTGRARIYLTLYPNTQSAEVLIAVTA